MNEQYYQTLKSAETEDWLDFHVIRPFCSSSLLRAASTTKVSKDCSTTSSGSSC